MSSQMKQSSARQNGPFDTLLGANEIKILIPEFNPSKFKDLYANEWINDVETLGRIHKWDNPRLLLYATMRLGGIARVWYEYSLEGITCWDDFKWDLLSNFPRTIEAADVHAKLAKRTRQPDEAIEEFVHNTVKLARKIQLDDCEIVEYLIQGIDQPKHQMVLSSLGICSPSEFLQHMQLLEDDSNGAVSSRHSEEVSPRLKDHQMITRREKTQEYFDGGESLRQRDRMVSTDEDYFDQRPFRPQDFQDPEDWRPGSSSHSIMQNPGSFADSLPFNQIQSFGPYNERFFPSYDPSDGRPLASTSDPYNRRLLPPSHNQRSFPGSAPDPITNPPASFQSRSSPASFQRRSSPSADYRSLPPASFQRRSSPSASFQRRTSPPASFQQRSSPSSHQLNPQATTEHSKNPGLKRSHSPDKKNPTETSDKKEAGPKGKKKKLKKCYSCMSTDHLIVDCPKKTGKKDPEEKQHQATKETTQSSQQATSSSTSNIPDNEKPKEDVGLKKENPKILKEPENRMQKYADMIAKQELLAKGKAWLAHLQAKDGKILHIQKILDGKIKKDPQEKVVRMMFQLINGGVYHFRNDGLLYYVPVGIIKDLILYCHYAVGHADGHETYKHMDKIFWLPSMQKAVKKILQRCPECIESSAESAGRSKPSKLKGKYIPFSVLSIGFCGPFDATERRNQYVFIMIDLFSEYVMLRPVVAPIAAVAIKALTEVAVNLVIPSVVVSNNAPPFTTPQFRDFCADNGIHQELLNERNLSKEQQKALSFLQCIQNNVNVMLMLRGNQDWDKKIDLVRCSQASPTPYDPKKKPVKTPPKPTAQDKIIRYTPIPSIVEKLYKALQEDEAVETFEMIELLPDEGPSVAEGRLSSEPMQTYKEDELVLVYHNILPFRTTQRTINSHYRGPYVVKKVLDDDKYVVTSTVCNSGYKFMRICPGRRMKKWITQRDLDKMQFGNFN